MKLKRLAIGLCTYKRPELLRKCLQSLHDLQRPENLSVCIIVADNDPLGSAASVVDDFSLDSCIPVHYQVEKQRGIPYARNNILCQAINLHITELAFIDDDEYVDERWLSNLWTYYVNSDADVVWGTVKIVYPSGTPAWIVKGGFYQWQQHTTGTSFSWAATNNVLFNFEKIVVERGFSFDDTFLLAGGSDTDFFRRVHEKGSIIRFVEDAVVYEVLCSDRMSVVYLLKRKWRVKNKVYFDSPHNQKKMKLFFEQCKLLFRAVFSLVAACFNGKHAVVKALSDVVWRVAKISALLGIYIKWNEYK